jgi:hypothetical protein
MSRGFVFVVALASMVAAQAVAAPKIGSGAVKQTPTRGVSKLTESQCTAGGGKIIKEVSIWCIHGNVCSTFRDGAFVHECINDSLPVPK